jgi:CheY-like chemotaxis protein
MGEERAAPPKWALVVDDDPAVRELWLEARRHAGYRALGSRDGAEALDMIRALVPDLILLDLLMPRMARDAFLEGLRHQGPFTQYIPVLLVSAYLGQVARFPIGVRVVGALEKPVSRAVLLKAVATALAWPPSDRSVRARDGGPPAEAATCSACSNGLDAFASVPGVLGGRVHLAFWARTLDAEARDAAQSSSRSAPTSRS